MTTDKHLTASAVLPPEARERLQGFERWLAGFLDDASYVDGDPQMPGLSEPEGLRLQSERVIQAFDAWRAAIKEAGNDPGDFPVPVALIDQLNALRGWLEPEETEPEKPYQLGEDRDQVANAIQGAAHGVDNMLTRTPVSTMSLAEINNLHNLVIGVCILADKLVTL